MSPNLFRCRHYNVNWIDSHSCQCMGCGKFGHWFEDSALVMWVREDKKQRPENETSRMPELIRSTTAAAVANRAG